MDIYEYGNPDSSTVLLQMVDDHDLAVIENEVAAIRKTADDFRLLAIKVKNSIETLTQIFRERKNVVFFGGSRDLKAVWVKILLEQVLGNRNIMQIKKQRLWN